MVETYSKWTVVFFGLFIISAGILMLFKPVRANNILRKAGSTNFINYSEITIRLIPAAGFILWADHSKSPEAFRIFGWFMLITSVVLYLVPRRLHHAFSLNAANIIRPLYFQLISPFAVLMGALIVYWAI
ncbi:hypothetical protein [Flavobacterium lindanitolerans]|uniref:hypothetical protein n=1 Tax=Flavobacterium lindanitolerans TaxID=428988 RepID=UPI0027B8D29E|nr:hypothetical protein [Flavobacterium lindanitolerans]